MERSGHLPDDFGSKLGAFDPATGWVPVRFHDCFCKDTVSGFNRLLIATKGAGLDLFESLAALYLAPYRLVYLLLSGTDQHPAGRFELSGLSAEQLAEIVERHRDFLSGDARHHLWLHATGGGTLILDEHDWLYAYGKEDELTEFLVSRGFAPGRPDVPFPHLHHEPKANDARLHRFLTDYPWQSVPVSN